MCGRDMVTHINPMPIWRVCKRFLIQQYIVKNSWTFLRPLPSRIMADGCAKLISNSSNSLQFPRYLLNGMNTLTPIYHSPISHFSYNILYAELHCSKIALLCYNIIPDLQHISFRNLIVALVEPKHLPYCRV